MGHTGKRRRRSASKVRTAGDVGTAGGQGRAVRPERLEGRLMFAAAAATPPVVNVSWDGYTASAYQGQYVIRSANIAKFDKLVTREGFTDSRSLGGTGYVQFTATQSVADMQRLSHQAGLGFITLQPNFYQAFASVSSGTVATPNDTLFGQQWGLDNTGQLESFDYDLNGVVTPYNAENFPGGEPAGGGDFPTSAGNPDENQYGIAGDDIDASQAWGITTGSKSVVVADLDSGLDITNPDVTPNLWTNPLDTAANGYDGDGYAGDIHGYSMTTDSGDVTDAIGHGTNTAGIIGAAGDNGQGVTGVDWNVSLLPVQIADASGVSDADEIAGINYCINLKDHGINIVAMNESFGGAEFPIDVLISEATRQAGKAGILTVAAAGNESQNLDRTSSTPGKYSVSDPSVITVAAVDNQFKLAAFSDYGASSVDLAAPGINILSTTPVAAGFSDETTVSSPYDRLPTSPLYGYESGTSQATPMVTGIIALEAAANPEASPAQLKQALLKGVTYDPNLASVNGLPPLVATSGVANAYRAVLDVMNPFVGTDTTRQGSWHSFYGYQGAYVVGDSTSFASPVATISTTGGSPVVVQNDTTNPAALQRPSDPAERVSAYEGAATTETINIDFTDGALHQTELYVLDPDHKHRTETVSIVDPVTGSVLDGETVSDFTKGEYLTWDLQGSVQMVITATTGGAAYSGLFIDQADSAPNTNAGTDAATGGANWRNTYGSQGDFIAGDNNTGTLPSYLSTFSIVGGTAQTVRPNTHATVGLQQNYNLGYNIEAYYAAADHEDVNVAFNDGLVHTVSLYLADYTNQKRTERIQVIDSANGGVLVTQNVVNFKNGEFLSFNVSGAVTFRVSRTGGPDAVVSGVFFDEPFGENAHFDGTNATLGGNWVDGPYGATAAYVVGDDFPGLDVAANSELTISGAQRGILATPTANAAALLKTEPALSSTRVEAYAFTASSMTVAYTPGDTVQHQLALYVADFENEKRVETVTIADATTGTVLASQKVANFRKGKYLIYDVVGPVKITITTDTTHDAVLSGVFVD